MSKPYEKDTPFNVEDGKGFARSKKPDKTRRLIPFAFNVRYADGKPSDVVTRYGARRGKGVPWEQPQRTHPEFDPEVDTERHG